MERISLALLKLTKGQKSTINMAFIERKKFGSFVPRPKTAVDKFRVRSPIKSFRDLEVYQKTIQLSGEITRQQFIPEEDRTQIKQISEEIPKLIAEGYGDKFDSKEVANEKMNKTLNLITDIITKIDLLREKFSEDKTSKENLDGFLTKYQMQRTKVLNLKKAWGKIYSQEPMP